MLLLNPTHLLLCPLNQKLPLSCHSQSLHGHWITTQGLPQTNSFPPCSQSLFGNIYLDTTLFLKLTIVQLFIEVPASPTIFKDLSAISSVQFSRSVMSYSLRPHELQHARPPVHHQLPEFTQTHVHRVGDAIQPSHPLSPPPPALSLSQHQSLLK